VRRRVRPVNDPSVLEDSSRARFLTLQNRDGQGLRPPRVVFCGLRRKRLPSREPSGETPPPKSAKLTGLSQVAAAFCASCGTAAVCVRIGKTARATAVTSLVFKVKSTNSRSSMRGGNVENRLNISESFRIATFASCSKEPPEVDGFGKFPPSARNAERIAQLQQGIHRPV
jgi:hypothetical protein